tara:strand:- start:72 stop:890 length:819 start_codon:yes stop_codon:yes gene_type:complete
MKQKILFSLVLYKSNINDLHSLLDSIINFKKAYKNIFNIHLVISDNSPKNKIQKIIEKKLMMLRYNFKYQKRNIGFGAGHNENIFNIAKVSSETLLIIINPDIKFKAVNLINIVNYAFENFREISCLAPLIYNNDNQIQYSAKRNPTFISLLIGRIDFLRKIKVFNDYLFQNKNMHLNYKLDVFRSSYLSGCFLLVPAWTYFEIAGFDEKYFLHLEDADFVRRCALVGKTIHYPKSYVYHKWQRGSHKSISQSFHVLKSYMYYLSKWGFELY